MKNWANAEQFTIYLTMLQVTFLKNKQVQSAYNSRVGAATATPAPQLQCPLVLAGTAIATPAQI